MTAAELKTDLSKARDAVLRSSLTLLTQGHKVEDIVQILGEVISDEGYKLAQRTGDYDRASTLLIIARYLERLDTFIDNYEPREDRMERDRMPWGDD